MDASRQERRRVRVSKIVEPKPCQIDAAHQSVPVARERVRRERLSPGRRFGSRPNLSWAGAPV